MAIGSVIGAFMSARRARPTIPLLVIGAAVFGVGCAVAAMMPDYRLFGLVLVVIGAFAQTFTVSCARIKRRGWMSIESDLSKKE